MLRLCKLLSTVKILLFLIYDFLCHVQGSETYRDVYKQIDLFALVDHVINFW